jgi:M6 family metalloprotease-like protein
MGVRPGRGSTRIHRGRIESLQTLHTARAAFIRLAAWMSPLLVLSALHAPVAWATAPPPEGLMPDVLREAFGSGLLSVPEPRTTATSATQSDWRVPIVMIDFPDDTLRYSAARFESALFDTTGLNPYGSVSEYWRWASGGRLRLSGRVVATVHLVNTEAFYGFGNWGLRGSATPNNMYGAIRDALLASESSVNWSEFDRDGDGYVDMLWVIHAGDGGETMHDHNSFWSITSRLSSGWTGGGPFITSTPIAGSPTMHYRLDRFTTLPELSGLIPGRQCEIGVYAHEFGHTLGLPDLYDTSNPPGNVPANVGPGYWSLMSYGGSGANGVTPESPSHPGAWLLSLLGWQTVVRPANDTTLTLAPIERGGPAIEVWFEGESWPEHFLLENRQRQGFDRFLTSPGLLLYHVDETSLATRIAANKVNAGFPGVTIVEADGRSDLVTGSNRGEASDPYPGSLGVLSVGEGAAPNTATFGGAPTGLALSDITPVGDSVRVTLQLQAPGWLPPRDRTRPGYAPIEGGGPARTAAIDAAGDLDVARSEMRAGLPQIVVRSRRAGTWNDGVVVTSTTGSASSPTLATLPGGDLAMAWSDTRDGASRIYYSARVRGSWTPAVSLAQLPGDAYLPSIAADGRGVVYVTWLQYLGSRLDVQFMRFGFASPFGTPRVLTDSTQTPEDPSVTVTPDGRAVIAWADRSTAPRTLWFSRFREDSGLTTPLVLVPRPQRELGAYTTAVDTSGCLHVVWFETDGSVYKLHYQRRDFTTPAWQRDTLIEMRSEALLQAPDLETDAQGNLHLAYECIGASSQLVRYKRWRPVLGWDARSSAISSIADGAASGPSVLPLSAGRVSVLYASSTGSGTHFMERDRVLDALPITAVPTAPARPPGVLAAWPAPLRPGQALHLRRDGGGDPGEVDILDIAGRRIARVTMRATEGASLAVIEPAATAAWPAGLYFARTRDGRAVARVVVLP